MLNQSQHFLSVLLISMTEVILEMRLHTHHQSHVSYGTPMASFSDTLHPLLLRPAVGSYLRFTSEAINQGHKSSSSVLERNLCERQHLKCPRGAMMSTQNVNHDPQKINCTPLYTSSSTVEAISPTILTSHYNTLGSWKLFFLICKTCHEDITCGLCGK